MRELKLFELRLLSLFYERYRTIWVQRSKYSIIVTVFPLDRAGSYRMTSRSNIYHGFGQETKFETVLEMVQSLTNSLVV